MVGHRVNIVLPRHVASGMIALERQPSPLIVIFTSTPLKTIDISKYGRIIIITTITIITTTTTCTITTTTCTITITIVIFVVELFRGGLGS